MDGYALSGLILGKLPVMPLETLRQRNRPPLHAGTLPSAFEDSLTGAGVGLVMDAVPGMTTHGHLADHTQVNKRFVIESINCQIVNLH